MAEFKDISLFATITPNLSTAQNYFVQVSATEKVSLAAIAGLVNVPGSKLGAWTPKAGDISANDTVLQALQKLQGNFNNLPTKFSSPSGKISTIQGGYVYFGNSGSTIDIDSDSFNGYQNCSIIIARGGQWSNTTFTDSGSVSAEIMVQKDLNDIGYESEVGDYVIMVIQYLGKDSSEVPYFAINASIYR